jgi:hypothetical protein
MNNNSIVYEQPCKLAEALLRNICEEKFHGELRRRDGKTNYDDFYLT